jgi:O-antigen biosynthesis protein
MLEASCFLSDDLVIFVGSFTPRRRNALDAWLERNGERTRLEGLWMPLSRSSDGWESALVALRLPQEAHGQDEGEIVVETTGGERQIAFAELGAVQRSIDVMLSDLKLSRPSRAALQTILLSIARTCASNPTRLAASLLSARDTLRERYPTTEMRPDVSLAAHVDVIRRIDESSFYIEGWLRHPNQDVTRLTVVSPEGWRTEIAPTLFRYARADVAEFFGLPPTTKLGFISFFATVEPVFLASGWVLELEVTDGRRVETDVPALVDDMYGARVTILADLELEALPADELRTRHIRPALERLEQRRTRELHIDTVDQHGVPPEDPAVSIIIPLHRRYDFLESQLAEWVHDPEMRDSDLIYVLDSPDEAVHVRVVATHLHRLYGVPFRLAVLTSNAGFAGATNLGVTLAKGRLLLLLNSDVLPEAPGWLSKMVDFYDATPNIGALAPKLLYEDGSIQHAGLYFDRPQGSHVWSNEHYFKGFHRDLPAANVSRAVPAVTGACMMIAADLYRDVGGLRTRFIQGDYEDSDLCLRLRQMGLETWYLASTELFHLEGQSYPDTERALLSSYNRWLNSYLWGSFLDDVMTSTERNGYAPAVA